MAKEGKIIIVSAPSGTGKSTIISQIIDDKELNLGFSVSCTSRKPRVGEEDGVNYYFVTPEEFKQKVTADEFIEWEEVYSGTCYGTLASEVERVTTQGKNLILDIDVKGALNVKKRYGDRALSIFVMPPSIDVLGERLRSRATDSEEVIRTRLDKAAEEISYAPQFDKVIINDKLSQAVDNMRRAILDFIR
ncbi:MAG: guanylate kinase [Muribaculaceae bacterium]|nr:guanylate kinase [Muribaculaceae bacterium]